MNDLKFIFIIFSFFAPMSIVSVKAMDVGDDVENFIYETSREMMYDFVRAADQIDSLEATLSDSELEKYKFYFEYIDACLARRKGHWKISFHHAERALEHFMYNGQDEWECRCLLLIAELSEQKRLFQEVVIILNRVTEISRDPYTKTMAYLNLARLREAMNLGWEEAMALSFKYSLLVEDSTLLLPVKFINCCLKADSVMMPIEMPLFAAEFQAKKQYLNEANAYKSLASHYLDLLDYEKALFYVEKSIVAYNKHEHPIQLLLASIHFLKGRVLFLLGEKDRAYHEYNVAIEINVENDNRARNYTIYRSLYRSLYSDDQYKVACLYLEKASRSYKLLIDSRLVFYGKMLILFNKIELIEGKLDELHRQSIKRIILISLLLFLIFMIAILWTLSLKRYFEKKSEDMEGRNVKLKEETGKLLLKSNQNKLTTKIIESQSLLERKIAKFLSQNKLLPDAIKDRYADTMLCFGVKLPMLSDTEKRYAVMIVLDVPIKSIAEILNVKPATVAQYRNRLRNKLGIANTEIELKVHLRTYLDD